MRAEWVPYFAAMSPEVIEVVAACGGMVVTQSRKLTPEAELELLRERVTREFGVAGARLVMSVGGGRRR